jgi:hypothetical protein
MNDRQPTPEALEVLDKIMKYKFQYDIASTLRNLDALALDDFAAARQTVVLSDEMKEAEAIVEAHYPQQMHAAHHQSLRDYIAGALAATRIASVKRGYDMAIEKLRHDRNCWLAARIKGIDDDCSFECDAQGCLDGAANWLDANRPKELK